MAESYSKKWIEVWGLEDWLETQAERPLVAVLYRLCWYSKQSGRGKVRQIYHLIQALRNVHRPLQRLLSHNYVRGINRQAAQRLQVEYDKIIGEWTTNRD